LPVFLEFQDLVPTGLVKLLLVTCAEKEECSLLLRPTEDGTEKSMFNKEDTLLPLLLLLLPLTPLFWLEDTELNKFPKFPWSSKIELNHMKRPKTLFNSSKDSEFTKMSKKLLTLKFSEPEKEN